MSRSGYFQSVVVVLFVLCAQLVSAAGGRVTGIEVEGNALMSDNAVKRVLVSQVGNPFAVANVEQDIRLLFRQGGFADIRVEKQKYRGGVKLVYRVVERPVLTSIRYEGNEHIRDKAFQEKLALRPFRALRGMELARAVATMHEMYEEKRYYLVDIDYRLAPNADGMDLTFEIKEHGRASVRRVQFIGNRVFSDRALKKVLRTKEKGAQLFRRGKYEREYLEHDQMLLQQHYLNAGYLQAHIETPRVEISKDKKHLFVTYSVHEGQQYKVGDIDVMGDVLTTKDELLSLMQMQTGQVYHHDTVGTDLRELVMFYGELGYAFANIQPIPQPDPASGTADIVYAISKGRRVFLDRINISGNTSTRDKVIRREMFLKEGDIFNRRKLEESREQLMALGFFESVDFSTPRGSRPDSVNLNITVVERPTGTFNIGAGFSTAEKFFFTGSVQKQNFFGRGISGQVALEISKLRQQYIMQATDPYFLDSNWSLSVGSSKTVFRYPEFDRKGFGGNITIGRRLTRHFSLSVGYEFEDVKTENFFFSVPQVFKDNSSGKTSAISLNAAYDTRDNRIFPKNGVFLNLSNQVSGSKLGGDNDFYRVTGGARYYKSLGKWLNTRFFLKGGYVKALGDRSVPLFERFRLGGPNSLRGFDIWSVGPSTRIPRGVSGGDTQFVYGGNKMMQANVEVEVPIFEPGGFRAVAFFDAGNVFAEEENITLSNIRMNYGVGLRWISPLGPLRFEWGFPIRKRPGEAGVVFNFTIGDFL